MNFSPVWRIRDREGHLAPQKRRQLFRIADVVGFNITDLRHGAVDVAKINNVEWTLRARQDRRGGSAALKRAFDILGAGFALLLLLPLFTLTSLAVWLSTPGPVIYSQLRHGLNGRPFRVYKFRTFFAERCDESGVLQAILGDVRITP